MYHLATKRAGKNKSKKTRTWVFSRHTIRRALQAWSCISSVIHSLSKLLSHAWVSAVRTHAARCPYTQTPGGCVHKLYPKEIRIRLYTSRTYVRRRPKLVTKTCLTARRFMNAWLRILYLVLLL